MFSWIREKFGTVVIGGIIAFIGFVFVFSGVFSPKSTRGLHEGAVAGKVNGDSVSISEFNKELNRQIEMYKNFSGGKLSEEQIQAFRLRENVFNDLVRRKLMIQEVKKQGLDAADEQVRDAIREIPAFQKEGKFDVVTYKQVLEANRYSPGSFEKLVREDLSAQLWTRYFARRAWVSQEEVRREFAATQDKRKIKYILLTQEAGRKLISVSPGDVQKYLAEATKLNLVKAQYEAKKETAFKGKAFDAVKETIAKDLIASDRIEEIQKVIDRLAEQVKPLLTADVGSNAKVNALLKNTGVEVKTTEWVTRQTSFLPGLGDAAPLLKEVFSKAGASQAKKVSLAAGTVVAVVVDSEKPDFAKFETEKVRLMKQLLQRKQVEMYQAWLADLNKNADIEKNPAVVGSEKS